jgi:hypothetical protein
MWQIGNRAHAPTAQRAKLDAGTSIPTPITTRRMFRIPSKRFAMAPNFDIADGTTSSICHMANTAGGVGRKLRFDPRAGCYQGDPEADRHLTATASPGAAGGVSPQTAQDSPPSEEDSETRSFFVLLVR